MNRAIVAISICLTVLTPGLTKSAPDNVSWISLNAQHQPVKPQAEILKSDASETIIRFTIAGFFAGEVNEGNFAYHILEFPGYAGTLEPGRPQLPVISELVAVPGNTNVTVSVLEAFDETFSGYNIYPFQTPLRENEKRLTFEIDQAQYNSNSFYPEEQVYVSAPSVWRDLRVVNLRVNPIQYNPVSSELKVCRTITVRLEYSGYSDVNVKNVPATDVTPHYDRMYRHAVLNYDYLGLETRKTTKEAVTADGGYDYLIIAADAYVDNMTPFIAWKNTQGLATQIVSTSQTGNRVSDIENYIANEYFTNGISYVLLVGNESDIPGDRVVGIFSDYSYALLEGDDYFADIAIGRFAGNDDTHIDNMVSKSITFEANPPAGEWLNKSLLIANWEEAPGKYQYCKEEIRTAAQTTTGSYAVFEPAFTTCYGASYANGGDEASNADVIDYFNEGFRLVNYRGHGDPEIWWYWNVYGEDFGLNEVAAINNGQMTPVVFSIACLNADLTYQGTTLAEAFMHADDGAAAVLGATQPSYTVPNHDYDKQLYKCVFDEGINAIGDASNEASVRVITLWGNYGLQNARMYLWLGDPSLQLIYNGEPPLAAPVLISPENESYYDEPAQPQLICAPVTGAVFYQFQLDDNNDFSSPLLNQEGVEETYCSAPELWAGSYYWRVRASDGVQYGAWSEVWSLSVGLIAQAPVLYAPSDGANLKTSSLILQWFEIPFVDEYYVEIDDNSEFSSPERTALSNICLDGICQWQVFPTLASGSYYWRVRAAQDGWPWSDVWRFKLANMNGIATDDGIVPDEIELLPNYPNPFNPSTEISFSLPHASYVNLEIFNIMGQRVSTLVDGHLNAGVHTVIWDGSRAASGVYLCRLAANDKTVTRRMIMVK